MSIEKIINDLCRITAKRIKMANFVVTKFYFYEKVYQKLRPRNLHLDFTRATPCRGIDG